MTNRSRYIAQRSEYDTMIAIARNSNFCPILAVSGDYANNKKCMSAFGEIEPLDDVNSPCLECIQKWLNAEGN